MGGVGQPDQSPETYGPIRDLFRRPTPEYPSPVMKKARKHPPKEDFIAPALRAFRRVARNLRAENARLGLPLIDGNDVRVKLVPSARTSAR